MEWKPIETAPKDIKVLVWDGSDIEFAEYRHMRNSYTGETIEKYWIQCDTFDFFQNGNEVILHPTHWFPIPEPPGKESER